MSYFPISLLQTTLQWTFLKYIFVGEILKSGAVDSKNIYILNFGNTSKFLEQKKKKKGGWNNLHSQEQDTSCTLVYTGCYSYFLKVWLIQWIKNHLIIVFEVVTFLTLLKSLQQKEIKNTIIKPQLLPTVPFSTLNAEHSGQNTLSVCIYTHIF